MEEIRSAMEDHMNQMADLIQKFSAELRSGFGPASDNFIGFFHAIDWKEETKEEREVRIRSLFNFFDKSSSGYLDYAEIEAGLTALHIPSEYKYARDLLHVCDADHDGRVNYGEFRRYMDDKELELYRIFQNIDVEHNGCILPEELYDALVKAGALVNWLVGIPCSPVTDSHPL